MCPKSSNDPKRDDGAIKRLGYFGYEELTIHLNDLAGRFPHLIQVRSAGKSAQGRDIWVATVTRSETGSHSDKPGVYLDGGMHSKEAVGTVFAMHTIESCLRNYGNDPLTTEILDSRVLYVLPNIAPDGLAAVMDDPANHLDDPTRYDQFISPADVNGDGEILEMRVQDMDGGWAVSSKDPRLMARRELAREGATFYRLYSEGFSRHTENRSNGTPDHNLATSQGPFGLRFNMQYDLPGEWPPKKPGFHARPFRDPATVAVADFLIEHPNICAALNYHAWGGVFLFPVGEDISSKVLGPRPPGSSSYHVSPEDLEIYNAIAGLATSATGYPSWLIDYSYSSFLLNWIWQAFGTFAATPELVNYFKYGPPDLLKGLWGDLTIAEYNELTDLARLSWSDKELDGKGCVEWQVFDHPELGRVELGGWNKRLANMPPLESLEEEMIAMHEFVLKLASWTPRLEIHDLKSERISDSHLIVEATFSNGGVLPTFLSQHALNLELSKPVNVELKGAPVLVGDARIEIGHLSGSMEVANRSTLVPSSSKPPPREQKLKWLVELEQDTEYLTITAGSDRAGRVEIIHRIVQSPAANSNISA